MKNQKGITLITLVITIIILIIITGVVTYSGLESVSISQKTAFISELEMIQAKVNVIYEERKASLEKIEYYNSIGQDISNLDLDRLTESLGETSKEGFKLFKPTDLEELGLDNINQEILINYDTREVVSLNGFEIDGIRYYKLSDIPNYMGYNVDYTNSNTEVPEFTVSKTKLSNNEYRFTIKDIVYNSNVSGGTVKYKKHSETNWILNGENMTFTIKEPGLYDICFTDSAGNSTTMQEWIYVQNGLIAHYDGENNIGVEHDLTSTIWKDLSGNGNDATLNNFDTLSSSGWEEKALNFDGIDDWVLTPIEDIGEQHTYEIALNIPQVITKNEEYIFNFSNSVGLFYDGIRLTKNAIMNIESYSNHDANPISYNEYVGKNQLFTISAIKNSASTFYSNGEAKLNYTSGSIENTTSEKLVIGDLRAEGKVNFTGKIYSFRFYNRALTEKEIKINYEIDKYRFGITE